ncbi:hypothetical protein DSCO28_52420 [Desulfosarcina ovata subsp. sediminis]|uniref:Uncharacterized protein n=1 Tax=Desulfosarcina ovata subsp. sediminis TaxID=885957 RepID=A0A5K7ZWX5_9BACT|nr:hypothetical protein DSCO28_52420 [Desulfosarcina ovata subsp. sediminis]
MKPAVPKKPGKIETRLSMAVLAVLVAIGVGVALRQFRISAAVLALRPESLHEEAGSPADQAPIIDLKESGMVPFSPPEHFTPDTLYEKIDGRADLYLGAGFVSLATQRFAPDHARDRWVEVFVYDMGRPQNAFSVFSMQRRETARTDRQLPNAYRTENALFMTRGPYYLEWIGTDGAPVLQEQIGILARRFSDTHGGADAAVAPGASLFPDAGLSPDSRQLITANAFGYEQLDNIHTAGYLIHGVHLTAFVSERKNADAATALADSYRQTLLAYGADAASAPPAVDGVAMLQVFDTMEIVFSRGSYLAGVHEATDATAAAILAQRLAEHLEGLTGPHAPPPQEIGEAEENKEQQ